MFKIVGRLDMLAWVDGTPPGLYHVQTKTLSAYEPIDITVAKYAVSMHERAYSHICEKSGLPIKGTLLNVLRKTLPGNIDKKTGTRKVDAGWAPFERHRLAVGERDRRLFVEDAGWLADRIAAANLTGAWPRFTQNCVRYNRKCGFYDVCRLGCPVNEEKFKKREPDYVDAATGDIPTFNVSRLQDFVTCPRLYWFKWIDRWTREEDEDAAPLVFGKAIHATLEAWYGPGKPTHDKKLGLSGWKPGLDNDKAIEAFRKVFEETPDHDAQAKETEQRGYGELLLGRYFEKYRETDKEQFRLILGVEVEGHAIVGKEGE